MKVKKTTDVKKLAGAIAGAVREEGSTELQAIGAAAVNQAIKAVIVARSYLIASGIDITITPSFKVIKTEEETTVIHTDIAQERAKKENGEDGNC